MRERILDAAEELFARSGFDGVPVRGIAKCADINLSLLTYHFTSKDQLFDSVIQRRSLEVNSIRSVLLDQYIADQSRDLRRLVEAYTMPFFLNIILGNAKWRNYGELIAQLSNSPKYSFLIKKYFDEIARRYAISLAQVFDGADMVQATQALVFTISVMMGAMTAIGRAESIAVGSRIEPESPEAHALMLRYVCGGIEGIMSKPERGAG